MSFATGPELKRSKQYDYHSDLFLQIYLRHDTDGSLSQRFWCSQNGVDKRNDTLPYVTESTLINRDM